MFPLSKKILIRGVQGHLDSGLLPAADYVAWYKPLYQPFDGYNYSFEEAGGGKWIGVKRTDNGDRIEFAHMFLRFEKSGFVKKGTLIGITGNSGTNTTGPHLHAQIKGIHGKRLDPEKYNWETTEVGKVKFIVVVDKSISDLNYEVFDMFRKKIEKDSSYRCTLDFDFEYVGFANDFVRKIVGNWTSRNDPRGGYVPDWWTNREWNDYSKKYKKGEIHQVMYVVDNKNWSPYLPNVGGFNKGVMGRTMPSNYLKFGMDFIRYYDGVGNALGISREEGLVIAMEEEFAHDLDNWGDTKGVEPKLDLNKFFGVEGQSTADGSCYDTNVVHARDSRYPRWDHSHIFNSLKDYLTQWFHCPDCEPLKLKEETYKEDMLFQKIRKTDKRVWAVQNGKRFWIIDWDTNEGLNPDVSNNIINPNLKDIPYGGSISLDFPDDPLS